MDIKEQLKQYEGTQSYQERKGYYRGNKFWPYKDSLGFSTIGYGHLILKGEDFSNGLTEEEADKLLEIDIHKAEQDAKSLGLNIPNGSRWNDFIVMMVFQLGITKTLKFKKFLTALKSANYHTAIIEVRDSNWYRQTPSRVDSMIAYVVKG